ncbi:hypothetical protein JXA40_04585 [bacterium]|nr:hypothetical protein [candidate division CSSED10-310 bacterium]
MDDDKINELTEALHPLVNDKKIACAQALNLASEFKVSPRQVGDLLNELKIKVYGCQLGCFK